MWKFVDHGQCPCPALAWADEWLWRRRFSTVDDHEGVRAWGPWRCVFGCMLLVIGAGVVDYRILIECCKPLGAGGRS